ncbi:hypothetical protein [Streptomyces bohaiensis]|uniref:hypothetical protein n=1 Tax=Streptomyces bohaiensis TaxID=1431344 RepID=UPI003B7D814C
MVIVGALLSLMVGVSVYGREAPESTMPEAYEEEAVEEEITPPPVASPPVKAPPVQAQPTPERQVTSEYEDFTRDTGLPPPDLRNPDGSYVYSLCEGSDYWYYDDCYPFFDEIDRYYATRR